MIAPTTISNLILAAELKVAQLVTANLTALEGGSLSAKWDKIANANLAINRVSLQYNMGDYGSPNFLVAYTCLSEFVGNFAGGSIDPNAQNPGTTIVTQLSGNFVQSARIPFGPVTTLNLSNWPTVYYPSYGDNPTIQVYTGDVTNGYQLDEQTLPIPVFPGNNITGALQSISWTWGGLTSGYYIISGNKPS